MKAMRWRSRPKLSLCCIFLPLLAWVILNGPLHALVSVTPKGSSLEYAGVSQTPAATLSLPEVAVPPGGQVAVPLSLTVSEAQVYSADIHIAYDPAVAAAVSVAKGALVPDWSLASNLETVGLIKVALAGVRPVTSGGELLLITFQALGEGGAGTALTLSRSDLNEGNVPATLEHGHLWICSRYDLDCDCDIDVTDIMLVAGRWRCGNGDGCYDPLYDLDDDGNIDIVDIMLVVAHWGETCP